MILTPEDRIARHVQAGAWLRVTLDQLFRRALQATPDAIAFEDCGTTSIPGVSNQLTYAQAAQRIDALAAFFAGIGLKPDMVLGIHLPACADATVIVLAAMRAGLVVCPLPIHWSKTEIEEAIKATTIRGIVTASEIEGDQVGTMVRDVAAETFTIRFVFAVGHGLPDGLIDLADVLADPEAMGPPPEITRRGSAADHIALVGLARSVDEKLVVVPFSHNHIVSAAVAHVMEGGIDREEAILSTMHPASPASLGAAVAAAFLANGRVTFHHPTHLAGLAQAAQGRNRAIVPAAFGPALAAVSKSDLRLALVSSGFADAGRVDVSGDHQVTDLFTLGGLCLIPARRVAGSDPSCLKAGPVSLPQGLDIATVFYELQVKPRTRKGERRSKSSEGELLLSGALIPDSPWPEPASGGSGAVLSVTSDGTLRSGLLVEVDGNRLKITGTGDDMVTLAGHRLSLKRLDALFARHPAVEDAAVFTIDGGLVGQRFGVAIVAKADKRVRLGDMIAWLDETGAGSLDRPSTVIVVPEIPRSNDGSVERKALFIQAVA